MTEITKKSDMESVTLIVGKAKINKDGSITMKPDCSFTGLFAIARYGAKMHILINEKYRTGVCAIMTSDGHLVSCYLNHKDITNEFK